MIFKFYLNVLGYNHNHFSYPSMIFETQTASGFAYTHTGTKHSKIKVKKIFKNNNKLE